MDEWTDDDDPRLRALFQYLLRDHVRHQDGRHSYAPTLVFANADYEEGDGTCGLHPDAKKANEPAIVYARADALVDAMNRIEALEADLRARTRERDHANDCTGAAIDRIEALEAERDALRQRAERAERRFLVLQEPAQEVAAFRAQITHDSAPKMGLIRALDRLECALEFALHRDEGGMADRIEALAAERDDLRQRAEKAEAEVARLRNPPEEYCAKCGAPKSNHPYRHPFQPRAALEEMNDGQS